MCSSARMTRNKKAGKNKGAKEVYCGKLFGVSREKRVLPSGKAADIELIRHPGAVLILPLMPGDRILLIRQYRPVIDAYIWELPAGTLESAEGLLACAQRELLEETGYLAKYWKQLGFIYPAPGYTTEKIFVFTASGLTRSRVNRETDEIIRVHVFSRADVKRLFARGRITDAKTICALARGGRL